MNAPAVQGRMGMVGLFVGMKDPCRAHTARSVADVFDSCFPKARKSQRILNARIPQPPLDLASERGDSGDRHSF